MIEGPVLCPAACAALPPGSCTRRNSAPYELGQRTSFWVAAGVVAHTLWTSAAPAMTYPLFAAEWHLTHTVTTGIFAIYPIVVAAVLIGFGDVSDYIGRRAWSLWGLGASLAGTLLFALAPDVLWLFAGRAFMGIGVGLTAGPSTAAMGRIQRPGSGKARRHHHQTPPKPSAFAAALLLGGALIQPYAPLPTRLNFWVLSAVLAALFAAAWLLPRHTNNEAQGRWRPRTPFIPSDLRNVFAVAAMAVNSAYTHGVLILSLGSQVARDLVGSPNTLVNGAALPVRDRLGRRRDWRQDSAAADRDDQWGRRLRRRRWRCWQRRSLAITCRFSSHSTRDLRRRIQPAVFRWPANDQQRGTGRAPRRRALGSLLCWLMCRWVPSRSLLGAVATAHGLSFAVNLGAGVILALFSVVAVALVVMTPLRSTN